MIYGALALGWVLLAAVLAVGGADLFRCWCALRRYTLVLKASADVLAVRLHQAHDTDTHARRDISEADKRPCPVCRR